MSAVRAGEVVEALPLLELGLEVDVAFGAEKLGELLLIRPVRAFDLAIELGRAGLDVGVPDALVLDVPVNLAWTSWPLSVRLSRMRNGKVAMTWSTNLMALACVWRS